jgi:hypothetical protein
MQKKDYFGNGRMVGAMLGYNKPQSHYVIGNVCPVVRNATGKAVQPKMLDMDRLEKMVEETKLAQATATLRSIEQRLAVM